MPLPSETVHIVLTEETKNTSKLGTFTTFPKKLIELLA